MTKLLAKLVLGFGIVAVILACLYRFGPLNKQGEKSFDMSSTLLEAIDIAELSTAEYKYRGIATVYEDEEQTEEKCRICYSAVVKAGINMADVKIEDDPDTKTIIATLPDIGIKVTIVDEESFAFLPEKTDIEVDRVLKCCREDAEKEAAQSEALITTAQENLKETIEGLAFPILKANGYTLKWK